MSNTMVKTLEKKRISFKVQTIATLAAIVMSVAIPQIFHAIGAVSGAGTVPGEVFLPMHLPVLLVGLLAGPYAGAVSGLLGPLASFALSGMPGIAMLPFMMIELCVYGLSAGLLRTVKMPTIGKLVISQVAGRLVRAAAILIAVFAFGNETVRIASIWMSLATGLPGLILQWTLIPLISFRVDHMKKNEQ